jgi:hypothetical protein
VTPKSQHAAPASAGAVRFGGRLASSCFTALLLIAAISPGTYTRERPPTGVTGGFGEPTCQLCHFEADVNTGGGRLLLTGVPERYTAGQRYTVIVTVVHAGAVAVGFEIAARFESGGAQAGSLAAGPNEAKRLEVTTAVGVQYAHHVWDGTEPVAPDTARWRVVWTAPASGGGNVVFHAVGNASNSDNSPLGDYVYTATAASRGRD